MNLLSRTLLMLLLVGLLGCQSTGSAKRSSGGLLSKKQPEKSLEDFLAEAEAKRNAKAGDSKESMASRTPQKSPTAKGKLASSGGSSTRGNSTPRYQKQAGPTTMNLDQVLQDGLRQEERGQLEQAQVSYETVTDESPDHPEANHRLGVLADRRKDYTQAEEHYLKALRGKPKDANLLSDMGYSYFLRGQYDQSEMYLGKALQLQPKHENAQQNMAQLMAKMGRTAPDNTPGMPPWAVQMASATTGGAAERGTVSPEFEPLQHAMDQHRGASAADHGSNPAARPAGADHTATPGATPAGRTMDFWPGAPQQPAPPPTSPGPAPQQNYSGPAPWAQGMPQQNMSPQGMAPPSQDPATAWAQRPNAAPRATEGSWDSVPQSGAFDAPANSQDPRAAWGQPQQAYAPQQPTASHNAPAPFGGQRPGMPSPDAARMAAQIGMNVGPGNLFPGNMPVIQAAGDAAHGGPAGPAWNNGPVTQTHSGQDQGLQGNGTEGAAMPWPDRSWVDSAGQRWNDAAPVAQPPAWPQRMPEGQNGAGRMAPAANHMSFGRPAMSPLPGSLGQAPEWAVRTGTDAMGADNTNAFPQAGGGGMPNGWGNWATESPANTTGGTPPAWPHGPAAGQR